MSQCRALATVRSPPVTARAKSAGHPGEPTKIPKGPEALAYCAQKKSLASAALQNFKSCSLTATEGACTGTIRAGACLPLNVQERSALEHEPCMETYALRTARGRAALETTRRRRARPGLEPLNETPWYLVSACQGDRCPGSAARATHYAPDPQPVPQAAEDNELTPLAVVESYPVEGCGFQRLSGCTPVA